MNELKTYILRVKNALILLDMDTSNIKHIMMFKEVQTYIVEQFEIGSHPTNVAKELITEY